MYDHRFRHDKRPRARALLPREHYAKKNGVWKPKRGFPDELSAHNFIASHWHLMDAGYKAYRCGVCGMWHIGIDGKHSDGCENNGQNVKSP